MHVDGPPPKNQERPPNMWPRRKQVCTNARDAVKDCYSSWWSTTLSYNSFNFFCCFKVLWEGHACILTIWWAWQKSPATSNTWGFWTSPEAHISLIFSQCSSNWCHDRSSSINLIAHPFRKTKLQSAETSWWRLWRYSSWKQNLTSDLARNKNSWAMLMREVFVTLLYSIKVSHDTLFSCHPVISRQVMWFDDE